MAPTVLTTKHRSQRQVVERGAHRTERWQQEGVSCLGRRVTSFSCHPLRGAPLRNAPGSRSRGRFSFSARSARGPRRRRIGPWPTRHRGRRSAAASGPSRRSGSASSRSALAYAVTARERRALAARDPGALGARLRGQRPVQRRRALRRRRRRARDRADDAAAQRAARPLRALARPRDPADAGASARSRPSSSPTRPSASSPRRRSARSRSCSAPS